MIGTDTLPKRENFSDRRRVVFFVTGKTISILRNILCACKKADR